MDTDQQRVLTQLRYWRSELLDLSNRNPLLNFRVSTTRPSHLKLDEPLAELIYDPLVDGKTLTIVGKDLADVVPLRSRNTSLPGIEDASPIPPAPRPGTVRSSLPTERMNRVALRLASRARASMQEQGINTLYAAFGLLKWQERPGAKRLDTDPCAPLVLLPVAIEEDVTSGAFRIRATGEDPEINLTLSERLKQDYGLALDISVDEDMRLADVLSNVREVVSGRGGWEVRTDVYVGHFQFHKLRMYKDLEEHAALAFEHDILRALALDIGSIATLSGPMPPDEGFDNRLTPETTYSILDADASQSRAIEAAKRGNQFIVSGPPGTGKSQTIANIIAECIAANRTVLFVSEKTAAIEVVHRRLSERGIGNLCLRLHSHKANKREIVQELGGRLNSRSPRPRSDDLHLRLGQLQETRLHLDESVEALHRCRQPMEKSVFWAYGQLAALGDVPLLSLTPPPLADLTFEIYERQSQLVQQTSRYAPVLQAGETHPWSGFAKSSLSLVERNTLQTTLGSLGPLIQNVQRAAASLAGCLSLDTPTTISRIQELIVTARLIPVDGGLRPVWFEPGSIREAETVADDAIEHATQTSAPLTGLLERYNWSFLLMANKSAIAVYSKNPFTRIFSSEFKQLRHEVGETAKSGKNASVEVEQHDLAVASEINTHLAWFRDNYDRIAILLGHTPDEPQNIAEEIWRDIRTRISVARSLLDRFDGGSPSATVIALAENGDKSERIRPTCDSLDHDLAQLITALAILNNFFGQASILTGDAIQSTDLTEIETWIASLRDNLGALEDWLQAQASLLKSQEDGLAQVIAALLSEHVTPEGWSRTYQRLVLTHWLDWIAQNEPTIRAFHGGDQSELVQRFRALDRLSVESAALRVHHMVEQRTAPYVNAGEPAILQNECVKQRRHMPLRRLFQRIPNLIPKLKPCLMMSPLSVAQFLPADLYQFDVIIFDEASQVRPHDAIGAIMRGKQLIVAGDSRQLPPSSFFDRAVEDDDSDDDLLVDIRGHESILDVLKAKSMPEIDLRWHYRSRHEDLIAFSNHHIYDGRLITFPSPTAERADALGVRLDFVADGRYVSPSRSNGERTRRVNEPEAARVVELVLEHARTRPDESLGVVTLGMSHKETIDDALMSARQANPALEEFLDEERPDPFFVKALEQVQGDERDVIIVSIGYGKNESGVLSHNFGPINRSGGERRLNVLVTRARNQIIVVSSIKASDIDLTRMHPDSLGPRLFKNYLDYAERGSIALEAAPREEDGDYESPFEEEVGKALERLGFTVHRQVGCSRYRIDLAIVHPDHPGRYLLGVECDGKTYHRAKTARDRDRLRQEILENLGWTIHRIWSTEWIRNQERELERVVACVQQLLSEESDRRDCVDVSQANRRSTSVATDAPNSQTDHLRRAPGDSQMQPVGAIGHSLAAATYQFAEINTRGSRDLLTASRTHHIAENVVNAARVEGPIHHDLLVQRISKGWGYDRTGARIVSCIDSAIRLAEREEKIVCQGSFIRASQMRTVTPRGEASDGSVRKIDHVCDEELIAGMSQVLASALSLNESELVTLTARYFGYQRTGRDIKQRLARIIPQAIQAGTLTVSDDQLHLAAGTT